MDTGSFFSGLFDWDFKHFVALKFIKVIYIIGTVFIALGVLAFIIAGISQGGSNALFGIVVGLLGGLLYLIFLRVWLEVIAQLFHIGENTRQMVTALGGQASTSGPSNPPFTPPATPLDTPPAAPLDTPPAGPIS